MPIYAYRCAACGFAKDVLQKISDPLLTVCPNCGKSEFQKQVTAAGFQLKGSGWYVTDFRGGGSTPAAGAPSSDSGGKGETAAPAAAPSASPAPAPAPAPTSKPSGGE